MLLMESIYVITSGTFSQSVHNFFVPGYSYHRCDRNYRVFKLIIQSDIEKMIKKLDPEIHLQMLLQILYKAALIRET